MIKAMGADELRQAFLDYFAAREHKLERSAPLVPQGDATLLFVNAGMVPFKEIFTGRQKRPLRGRPRRRSVFEPAGSTTTSRTSA